MKMDIYSLAKVVSRQFLVLCLFALASTGVAMGQQNPLNRKIDLRLRQVRLDDALFAIGRAANFDFSYNTSVLPTDSLVQVDARGESVRKVLGTLLGNRFQVRPVGNHLVITPKKADPEMSALPESYQMQGFLIDAASGEKVSLATVFANAGQYSTLTDSVGHYQLELPGSTQQVSLSFSKRGYHDTVVVVRPDRSPSLTVGMRPDPTLYMPLASRGVSLGGDKAPEPLPFVDWFVSQHQQTLAENLPDPIKTYPFQISFLPSIGTNRLLSGGMVNNFSFNILAGYSNGLRGFELGGLANIDRENVSGCQIAGLVNVVGGNVSGLQIGGLINSVRGNVNGVQIAGLMNIDRGDVKGLQLAGLMNIAPRPVEGAQVSGLLSMAKGDVKHVQIGGILSHAVGNVGGFQIGGISSYAKGNVGGFQIGGISSYAKGNTGGFQIAGISSVSKGNVGGFQIGGLTSLADGDVKGFQIAGIFNKAKNVKGFQIGLVNVADSLGGFQLGLINVVKKGYTVVEFGINESFQANLAYKAGRRGFYNLLTVGYRFGPRTPALAYGAGLGTMGMVGPVSVGAEAVCYHVSEEGIGFGQLNLLIPVRASVGVNMGRFEFYGGPSASLHITQPRDRNGEIVSQIGGKPFWEHDGYWTHLKSWAGFQAGVRIALNGGGETKKKAEEEDEE